MSLVRIFGSAVTLECLPLITGPVWPLRLVYLKYTVFFLSQAVPNDHVVCSRSIELRSPNNVKQVWYLEITVAVQKLFSFRTSAISSSPSLRSSLPVDYWITCQLLKALFLRCGEFYGSEGFRQFRLQTYSHLCKVLNKPTIFVPSHLTTVRAFSEVLWILFFVGFTEGSRAVGISGFG